MQLEASFTAFVEMEKYAIEFENIHQTALSILSSPADRQIFENVSYASGTAEEQNVPAEGYTVLNIKRGSLEAQVDVLARYGGKDGMQIDGYFKGEAHDDRGNYAEGRFDHNFNRNEGNLSVRGGSKDEIRNSQ